MEYYFSKRTVSIFINKTTLTGARMSEIDHSRYAKPPIALYSNEPFVNSRLFHYTIYITLHVDCL